MADGSPLLSQPTHPPEKKKAHFRSIDEIMDQTHEACTFQRTQLLQVTLLSLAYFFDGQQTFISIFSDAVPTWHCAAEGAGACTPASNICDLPAGSWAWDGGRGRQTFVADWGLQCAGSVFRGLPASAFFLGSLLGGFLLAPLADSSLLGRKNLMVLSCAAMSVPAILVALVSNVWAYAALRFFSGFGRSSIGTCFLVLSSEIVSKKWRGQVGIFGFLAFTLGFLSLSGIAYLSRAAPWKILYLVTAVPAAVYCLVLYLAALESPRWLYTQGCTREAIATLKRIAPVQSQDDAVLGEMLSGTSPRSSGKPRLYEVMERGWAVRRLLLVALVGFGNGLVYYGMPLSVGNLGFSPYIAAAFNALSEIPSSLLAFFIVGAWKRRASLLGFMVASGLFSAVCAAGGGVWVAAELGSFFCAVTASSLLLIYTLELFPTCVRNSATSAVRQMQVFGGTFGPLLAAAGTGDGRAVFYGVMGLAIVFCGLFVVFLPETKGGALCDTMDEQETMERDRHCSLVF